jgi:hypothetical protein
MGFGPTVFGYGGMTPVERRRRPHSVAFVIPVIVCACPSGARIPSRLPCRPVPWRLLNTRVFCALASRVMMESGGIHADATWQSKKLSRLFLAGLSTRRPQPRDRRPRFLPGCSLSGYGQKHFEGLREQPALRMLRRLAVTGEALLEGFRNGQGLLDRF